ncbi:hypothetical protein BpHYR1_036933 [Brachionus plicatilis]|uniref:Uncharacterized protein n=1 Tax=Brachionus plicatilis TaxID=10195 RepID=A0A3M7PI48_BRAPC|nr:hypothetical protein BpHYR1_036933 [Brachionus plicatilis]
MLTVWSHFFMFSIVIYYLRHIQQKVGLIDFRLGIIRITKKFKSFSSRHVELGIKCIISHVFDLFYEIKDNIVGEFKKPFVGFNIVLQGLELYIII